MVKDELRRVVGLKLGMTVAQAEEVIRTVLHTMYNGAMRDGAATFEECKFIRREYAPRRGNNIHLKQVVTYPARVAVTLEWDYKRTRKTSEQTAQASAK